MSATPSPTLPRQGGGSDCRGTAIRRKETQLQRRGADHAIAVTHVLAREIEAAGVRASNIVVMHNGVRLSEYISLPEKEAAKSAINIGGKLVIGFTGFLREWNGLERLMDWIADCGDPQRYLLIVGDGPACPSLLTRVERRGVADRVTFTGIVARDVILQRTAAFDVAVIPDVTEYASPLKLFEYLAAGRVVVAPATQNPKEILVDSENALLFSPTEPDGLQRALDHACGDPALMGRIGDEAHRTVTKRFLTWSNNADAVAKLFIAVQAAGVATDGGVGK